MWSYGDIVIVDNLLDPNGVNAKSRPCIVVSRDEEIAAGGAVRVVAISTMLPGPTPPDVVVMQYHSNRHPRTGLRNRCAAFARWMVEVEPAQISRKIGFTPGRDLLALAEILARLYPPKDEDETSTATPGDAP